jgi:hypothetical protein
LGKSKREIQTINVAALMRMNGVRVWRRENDGGRWLKKYGVE